MDLFNEFATLMQRITPLSNYRDRVTELFNNLVPSMLKSGASITHEKPTGTRTLHIVMNHKSNVLFSIGAAPNGYIIIHNSKKKEVLDFSDLLKELHSVLIKLFGIETTNNFYSNVLDEAVINKTLSEVKLTGDELPSQLPEQTLHEVICSAYNDGAMKTFNHIKDFLLANADDPAIVAFLMRHF